MRGVYRIGLAAVVGVVMTLAASAQTEVHIQGCGLVADALRVPLSEGFHARYSDIVLTWDDAGCAAVFTSLFAGAADFGVVSRGMRADEIELAGSLGLDVRELILGLDGIAVIVHPENDVEKLSVEHLEAFYRGGMASWLAVGGADMPVRLVSALDSSGIQVVFKELVFGAGEVTFKSDTEHLTSTQEVIARVASEPGAIGFVSMSSDRAPVRTVPITEGSQAAVVPNLVSVSNATYPLRYPVYLYTLAEPEPEGLRRRFLRFLYLHEGAGLVAQAGLVPIQSFGVAFRLPSASPRVDVSMTRVGFGFRGSRLDAQAREELVRLASRLAGSDDGVWIAGHEEPTEARGDLALARARAIAAFLEELDVDITRMRLVSRATAEPLASNAELEGRRLNRRAEVWILPNWPNWRNGPHAPSGAP
jgi:phosphate transport system substrate-binding protein